MKLCQINFNHFFTLKQKKINVKVLQNMIFYCYSFVSSFIEFKKRINVIYKHPMDPRLLYTKLSSGEKFYVYFVHDVETGTIKPKMVANVTPEQGTFLIDFDKNGQIKRIHQNNGKNQINLFIAVSRVCEIRIYNKISRENKHLLKTLNTCKSSHVSLSKTVLTKGFAMYTSNIDKLRRLYHGVQESENNNSSSTDKYIKVKVKVESCGTDRVDADVSVNIDSDNDQESSSESISMPVFRSQDGGYFFRLPNVTFSFKKEYEEKCKAASGISTRVCSSSLIGNKQIICSDLNDSLYIGINFTKPDIESSCQNLFESIEEYCNQIKANYLNFQTNCIPNYDEGRNIFATDELLLKPVVTFGSGKVMNKLQQKVLLRNISLWGAPDILITDDKPEFRIIGVIVTPHDPLPLDLYQVRLDYACATNYTLIDMRIRGSDLYTNYATCSGTNQCSCCILHAAGAAGSVVDHILINITDPWTGTNLTKTVVVVF